MIPAPAPETTRSRDELVQLIAQLAPDRDAPVSNDALLIDDLGYDSARIMELAAAMERRCGCTLTIDDPHQLSVQDALDALDSEHTDRDRPDASPPVRYT